MTRRDFLSFTPDTSHYSVVAIHTSAALHQIAWLLNDLCDTEFWRADPDLTIPGSGGDSLFACFNYKNQQTDENYFLLANNGTVFSLVSVKPRPDYLLISNSENAKIYFLEWVDKINHEHIVQHAYFLPESSKQKLDWLVYMSEFE